MLSIKFSYKTRVLLGQMVRFGVVGALNTLVTLSIIYAMMLFFKCSAGIANAIGYAVGIMCSFVLNWIWTFKSTRSISHVLPKYAIGFAISYLINLAVVLSTVRVFDPYLSQIFGSVAYSIVFFFASRFFVYF